jgi:hypothetical protein
VAYLTFILQAVLGHMRMRFGGSPELGFLTSAPSLSHIYHNAARGLADRQPTFDVVLYIGADQSIAEKYNQLVDFFCQFK